ncbi:MAG TPA: DUF1203 domain-containing protein [Myxococcota bacterium]|nr:DUF1203 domain-containing protein [Myxococcota bacterium]
MSLVVRGIPTDAVLRIRRGGPDANGQPALRRIAEGVANPCRHCLGLIAEGDENLLAAGRPFPALQPYAETGLIFLHARECARYEGDAPPGWFAFLDPALVRGHSEDDWIRYDTGCVVAGPEIAETCARILADPTVAYVHVRSKYNCFQCRVDRAAREEPGGP